MKNLRLYKLSAAAIMMLSLNFGYSQQKYVESFNVDDGVEIFVNTSYTNVIFDTWNQDKVEVEAYIEGDSEEKNLMKNWDLDISGNSKKITISSQSSPLSFAMGDMPQLDFIGPMMEHMTIPNFQYNIPPFPEGIMENLGRIQFDYNAFHKDAAGYLEQFEAQMNENFGADFHEKMEAWSKKTKDSIGKINKENMDAYGKQMEAWGEAYEKKMEAWANEMEKRYKEQGGDFKKTVTKTPHGTSIVIQGSNSSRSNSGSGAKTLIIRMPKDAKTNVNIRHGNLKIADATNLKANLNYTPFKANSIDGGQTLVSVAYAPVLVNTWKQGVLKMKYVDNCSIAVVQNINLQANSSDVTIGDITKQAFLSGSFGNLKIEKISDAFETLDITLENTDALVKLPVSDYSFYFNGRRSNLKYPQTLNFNESKNIDRLVVKGFNKSNTSNKSIAISSNYSNVSLQ